ncbi:MAG: sugar phosphate isomerase/epimerase [Clostridia bacterium]|nr:sugar phosphate isomerase/epimerase [Clostridia bacterium]
MKFGMPTLIECPDLPTCVREAASRGLDFLEVNLSFPQYRSNVLDPEAMRLLGEEYGIFYTFHADEQLNPFDFDDRVSDCYMRIMADDIAFAKEVGAPVINLHLLTGVYVTLTDRKVYLNDVYREDYLKKVQKFIRICEEAIGNSDLKICIENVDTCPFTESQREALRYFLASPVFALTMDVGHETCLGGKNLDIYCADWSRRIHMHLHDSDGKRAHLALGDGIVKLDEVLFEPLPKTCLIEVKTLEGLDKSIETLKRASLFHH